MFLYNFLCSSINLVGLTYLNSSFSFSVFQLYYSGQTIMFVMSRIIIFCCKLFSTLISFANKCFKVYIFDVVCHSSHSFINFATKTTGQDICWWFSERFSRPSLFMLEIFTDSICQFSVVSYFEIIFWNKGSPLLGNISTKPSPIRVFGKASGFWSESFAGSWEGTGYKSDRCLLPFSKCSESSVS